MVTRRVAAASERPRSSPAAATTSPPPRAAEERGGDSSLADVALLNDALAAERRAGHRGHVALIEREIARARGREQPLDAGPLTEDEFVAFYVDMLPKLAEPRLREVVAGLLADWARERARQRVAAGGQPAKEPFV